MKHMKLNRTQLIEKSLELLKKYQHETGSFPASPNFDEFRYCFLRDASFCAYALLLYGEVERCRKFLEWCHRTILSQSDKVETIRKKASGSDYISLNEFLPVRYELDGTLKDSDWPNFQIDCYGTWLWCLEEYVKITKDEQILIELESSVNLTISYLKTVWTFASFDCWEEHQYRRHTSSLACVAGGLASASRLYQDENFGRFSEAVKKALSDSITGEGIFPKFLSGEDIDTSFLWLSVPFNVFNSKDATMLATLKEIESRLIIDNGVYRYPNDTYYGGGRWPLLNSFLAWYKIKLGKIEEAEELIKWTESVADENGFFPENNYDVPLFPEHTQKWIDKWGAHVTPPLLWTQAMYLIAQYHLEKGSSKFIG